MTQLEAFFLLNQNDPNARQYLYDEIPQHYVWNDSDHVWNLRKRGKQIGRLAYCSAGELWYLRLLLSKVRGPTSFECLRTVKGKLFATFHEACQEYGLLDSDKEWHEVQNLRDFAKWVLDVGDGKIKPPTAGDREYHDDDISIPEHFCNLENSNSVDEMIDSTFPDFLKNFKDPEYLSERAILTPTNQIVGHVNTLIVEKIPGEMHSYYSVDSAEDFPGSERDQMQSFPPEYMNSLNVPGLPLHELKLKVGTVVMLMRNLNQTLGLCNGTRMMGTKHFIPRMELSPSETRLPFRLCRKQMPLQICYAMTINKSQGQSLEKVALFLPKPVFTHGQLYVAISRVTSPQGLKLFINDEEGNTTNIIANVVYRQIFYNLPLEYYTCIKTAGRVICYSTLVIGAGIRTNGYVWESFTIEEHNKQ
ncbi:hypothetical protein DCAR_0729091 [Daucus carota subsp. sativus]|uniref:ATP-dependent DNA helicase n=1 Tax=Daucus carota subsp. sativus TaxID=79200 RepID=A0AAF0XKB8_DAUCS|nr:hypothetical protein DCAR_0729091 [Daucus carota subsp. sativus]